LSRAITAVAVSKKTGDSALNIATARITGYQVTVAHDEPGVSEKVSGIAQRDNKSPTSIAARDGLRQIASTSTKATARKV